MIAPLVPYAIKGAIWYQGEANGGRGAEYRATLGALINDWRAKWNEGNFPFLLVQLPEYQDAWGLLRESQLKTLELPNTGMAVAIDVGVEHNIHPPFKEIAGDRLALAAEHVAYGANLVYSGPIYSSMQAEGNAIRLSFDHVGGGLTIGASGASGHGFVPAPTDHLVMFTIAGEDKQWFPAEARIEGDAIVVSNSEVPHPVAVRYGWDPPGICNLYNKEGLPASPFRTDAW
jgi:sialate O-acetylesterase